MDKYMTFYKVTYADELDNYKEKTEVGFVCESTHSEAVKAIEDYYGERSIIEVTVQAWDTDVLIVPEDFIKAIEKENGF